MTSGTPQSAGAVRSAALTLEVISARGTTGRQAKRVLRAASRRLNPADYQHLDAPRHLYTLGYRCTVYLLGDSS